MFIIILIIVQQIPFGAHYKEAGFAISEFRGRGMHKYEPDSYE